jgi:hypothetical protein
MLRMSIPLPLCRSVRVDGAGCQSIRKRNRSNAKLSIHASPRENITAVLAQIFEPMNAAPSEHRTGLPLHPWLGIVKCVGKARITGDEIRLDGPPNGERLQCGNRAKMMKIQ